MHTRTRMAASNCVKKLFKKPHGELSLKLACYGGANDDDALFRGREQVMLTTVSWYWGNISDMQVQYIMKRLPNGSFLVASRQATDRDTAYKCCYKIAVKLKRHVYFLKVKNKNGVLSLSSRQPKALTLYGLVTKLLLENRLNGSIGELCLKPKSIVPIKLTNPVTRVASLKANCRRVLRLIHENAAEVELLPLPKCLKSYLNEI